MAIEIRKTGVVPEWARTMKVGRKAIYPFNELEVGGTFVLPADAQTTSWRTFQSYVYRVGCRTSKEFKARRCANGSFEVVRTK